MKYVPNILTTIRLFLVPLFVAVFFSEHEMHTFAALIFLIASATDVADGYIARRFNITSRWGQLMDPLADKCMQLAVLVSLFIAGQVPVWFLVILACKELMMVAGSIFLYSRKTYVKANIFGKANTVFVFLVMTLFLLMPNMSVEMKNALLGASALLTLLAFVNYTYLYFVQDKGYKKNKEGETL